MTTEMSAAPTLRTYLIVVRRRKWWLAGFALLGLAGSLAMSFTQPKQYSATAQLLVQPSSAAAASGISQQPITPTDVQTELQLVTSAPVEAAVRRQLGNEPPVSAAQVAQTNVIAITASNHLRARAALIANAYANAFVAYRQTVTSRNLAAAEEQLKAQISLLSAQVRSLQTKTGAATQMTALLNQEAVLKQQAAQMQVTGALDTGDVELVTPAQAPTSPSSPKPARDGGLGLAAGLIAGFGIAFLRDNLDEALSSKEAAEHLGGAPVLGMVPTVTSWKKTNEPLVVSDSDPASPAAEAYRSLRTALQFARQGNELRTLLVTSPAADEGKTTTVANLGAVFTQAGERVVLVSADLRWPRLSQFFGCDEQVGLTTVLLGEQPLEKALQRVSGHETLWLLPAGRSAPNPAELLSGPKMREILATLRESFDWVLIDSAPLLPVTDAVVLSKEADRTLLVVGAGQTKRIALRRSAERLSQVKAPVLGIVLNGVDKQAGYGYGYGYGSYRPEAPGTDVVPHANGKAAVPPSTADGHDAAMRRP